MLHHDSRVERPNRGEASLIGRRKLDRDGPETSHTSHDVPGLAVEDQTSGRLATKTTSLSVRGS